MPSITKQHVLAASSFILGAWAFKKVNEVSGPAFEPILEACMNPDYKDDMDAFVTKTGYHAYDAMVGLKVFDVLVCLITQFLLELRETYPAGVITWGGVVLASLGVSALFTVEAGRKGARGILSYPLLFGLLFQLFGISVVFPLLYVPTYILGKGSGPVSSYRTSVAVPANLPTILLTCGVFALDTDSYLWTLCAGTLGGPGMPIVSSMLFWGDATPKDLSKSKVEKSKAAIQNVMRTLGYVGAVGWYALLYIIYDFYGGGLYQVLPKVWDDIWVNAGPSVAFMTIDTGVLYAGAIILVASQSSLKALKAVALLPIAGPAAVSFVLAELEETRYEDSDDATATDKKKE